MALTKRTYENGKTVITAENLNEIQDEVIRLDGAKAPAGYGLGADPTYVADANTCKNNGWFYIDENTANKPKHIDYAVLFVYRRNYMEYVQEVVDVTKGSRATRNCYNGETWSEWEFVNPPMIPGVEYRTTERWNGKAVYAKMMSCGTLTNGAEVALPSYTYLIRHQGMFGDMPMPVVANGGGFAKSEPRHTESGWVLSVSADTANLGLWQMSWYENIWYIKD